MQHVHGADTGTAFHSWPETPLIFSKHRKHFSLSGGRALGIRHTVCDSRSTSRVVFFSSAQKLLERAFTVIVTWPQARATEVCSTAHPHTQSQYIHPLAHSVSPKPSGPWLALNRFIPLPKMHLEHPDYVLGRGRWFATFCFSES